MRTINWVNNVTVCDTQKAFGDTNEREIMTK